MSLTEFTTHLFKLKGQVTLLGQPVLKLLDSLVCLEITPTNSTSALSSSLASSPIVRAVSVFVVQLIRVKRGVSRDTVE